MLPEDVRDFILVVTVEGEVAILPLHLIERVQGGGPFHTRCEGLQEALLQRDLAGINRYLAPWWAT